MEKVIVSPKKTGILGGSFDPVHSGHIELARAACKEAKLDEIIFVPARQAPLRDAPVKAKDADRLAMLNIALKDFECPHKIETCELDRRGISYSVDTAKYLKNKYPGGALYWIIGSDHLAKLRFWRNIETLATLVSFLCAKRPNYPCDRSEVPSFVNVKFFDFAPMPHNSTQIRNALESGEDAENMLDPNVKKYILDNKIYKK